MVCGGGVVVCVSVCVFPSIIVSASVYVCVCGCGCVCVCEIAGIGGRGRLIQALGGPFLSPHGELISTSGRKEDERGEGGQERE